MTKMSEEAIRLEKKVERDRFMAEVEQAIKDRIRAFEMELRKSFPGDDFDFDAKEYIHDWRDGSDTEITKEARIRNYLGSIRSYGDE